LNPTTAATHQTIPYASRPRSSRSSARDTGHCLSPQRSWQPFEVTATRAAYWRAQRKRPLLGASNHLLGLCPMDCVDSLHVYKKCGRVIACGGGPPRQSEAIHSIRTTAFRLCPQGPIHQNLAQSHLSGHTPATATRCRLSPDPYWLREIFCRSRMYQLPDNSEWSADDKAVTPAMPYFRTSLLPVLIVCIDTLRLLYRHFVCNITPIYGSLAYSRAGSASLIPLIKILSGT
jgi:hypothetical protein